MNLFNYFAGIAVFTAQVTRLNDYAKTNPKIITETDLPLINSIVWRMEQIGNLQSVKDLKEVLGDISVENNHLLADVIQEMTPWIIRKNAEMPDVIVNMEVVMVNSHVDNQTNYMTL
jgi:hypothetical protein